MIQIEPVGSGQEEQVLFIPTGKMPDFLSLRFNADRILVQRPASMDAEEWEKVGSEIVELVSGHLLKFMEQLPTDA